MDGYTTLTESHQDSGTPAAQQETPGVAGLFDFQALTQMVGCNLMYPLVI